MWFTYIILTKNNKYYTGISTDVQRRFNEHKSGIKGAKFTRINPPLKIVFQEIYKSRSMASKREYQIKQMSRKEKEKLIRENHI